MLDHKKISKTLCIFFFIIASGLFISQAVSLSLPPDQYSGNDTQETAALIAEDLHQNLSISTAEEDWYKMEISEKDLVSVKIYYDKAFANLSLAIISTNGSILNQSSAYGSIQSCSYKYDVDDPFLSDGEAFLQIKSLDANTTYDLYLEIITYGDNSGFSISDEFLNIGLKPNTFPLILTYMMMFAIIALWLEFGFSFINKGRKSENVAQGSYYTGLGAFILSVAAGESSYLVDLFSRDVLDKRIFLETTNYPDPFYSFINMDYFLFAILSVLIGLTFLMYPMEKYLYAHKRKIFTLSLICCIPIPIIIRVVEIYHTNLGLDLSERGTFPYQMISIAWIVIIFIGVLALIYLFKLYIDLGSKSPKGSKLRKKSRYIIYGLVLWVGSIFLTSSILKEISKVNSSYGPFGTPLEGTYSAFVQSLGIYPFLPFLIPLIMFISLRLLIAGFTRDY